ncbi:phosphate ABC transporter permease PstA [Bacillota bacterium LX-D]|nr:phosphate ABC transporter permease PstA [Bacillota bacterium LX-D]
MSTMDAKEINYQSNLTEPKGGSVGLSISRFELRYLTEKLAKFLVWSAGLATIGILLIIIGYIIKNGFHVVNYQFLFDNPKNMGRSGGIFSTIVSTVYLTGFAILVAAPVGIAASIYLTEYAKENFFLKVIRFGTETLAGVPSIVFGLFGFAFFVVYLELGWSLLSGGLTLALMILPIIIRTTEEAIKNVPNAYREGSLALGATKWHTIKNVVLPVALPAIMTGIILGIGRAIGETAAVVLTAGSSLGIPSSLLDPGRTMPVHLYIVSYEGISMDNAYGTAFVLIVALFLMNLLTNKLIKRFTNPAA